MKRRILAMQNHAVRLHEKTVHLRGQAFSTKTGLAKQHDSLFFNQAPVTSHLTVHGRIANLFDKEYETAYGYQTSGREYYLNGSYTF
ncbi:hypothetical protein EXD76_07895 [BEV proteobacterium]|nr:hypothetical protein [Candidatus Symbiopectobacterium sp. Chty_BC]